MKSALCSEKNAVYRLRHACPLMPVGVQLDSPIAGRRKPGLGLMVRHVTHAFVSYYWTGAAPHAESTMPVGSASNLVI